MLALLDAVQDKVRRVAGVSKLQAFNDMNLAPLCVRRDIAMLGLIHRTALGKGPPQFREHFRKHNHDSTLHDPRSDSSSPLIKRSALGLVAIYNMLPPSCRAAKSVPAFQKSLQEVVTKYAASGNPQWSNIFSPRLSLTSHPLAMHVLSFGPAFDLCRRMFHQLPQHSF